MHAMTLAAHANGWHDGHWWVVFPILWLLLAALALTILWRRGRNSGDGGSGGSAKRILGERFARGEINAEEYRDRLAELR
jgi:putative membrane protein